MPFSSLKSKEFILATVGIIMMPIGASIVYNYQPLFLQVVSHIYTYKLSLFLFIYGLFSIFGTWLGGKLIAKRDKATLIIFQFPVYLWIVFNIRNLAWWKVNSKKGQGNTYHFPIVMWRSLCASLSLCKLLDSSPNIDLNIWCA